VSAEAAALFAAETKAAEAPLPTDIAGLRVHYDAFNARHLAVARDHYAVDIVRDAIAGVAVDIVTPAGIDIDHRTLLCLHGGAFMWGRGAGALLEAVPVAATAKMRVIAVEYALAPEQVFPAAVDDVLAVYRALLDTQPAQSIGIYGCSAGGALTAQTVARIIAEGDPLPGAVAMLHGTGLDMDGDSRASAAFLSGTDAAPDAPSLATMPYLAGASADDPLVFPGEHSDVLAQFPPSLLVTGTRDFAASSVSVMHRRLHAAGADASLLHFDGIWHAHHMATTLPESRETFAALAHHFDNHLA
jgi:acetyl esterase/lipase